MTTARRGAGPVRLHGPARRRARRRRRSGQVLVMALLAIGLMVGVIFYVYNTGRHVNTRLTMQNVADSVAISGADWTARSMNVIAMNNCAQSRMLAIVPVLDSLPLATEMALAEVTAWEDGITGQLARGLPDTKDDYLTVGMENLAARVANERAILEGLNEAFNVSLDMRTVTHWAVEGKSGPQPDGSLWRTAMALEEFSYVTWQSSDVLAQANAVRFGEANGADVALLLPLTPKVPARVGEYLDFQPVLAGESRVYGTSGTMTPTGRRGGGIPDFAYPHRLGPWYMLYKWRNPIIEYVYGCVPDTTAPPPSEPGPPPPVVDTKGRTRTTAPGGSRTACVPDQYPGGVCLAGSGNQAGWPRLGNSAPGECPEGYHWGVVGTNMMGWSTYGPFAWAHGKAVAGADAHFSLSVYDTYIDRLSRAKFTYMFTPPEQLRTIHCPEWANVNNYPAAKAMGESDQASKIYEVLYYRVEVRSSIPPTSANYLTPGTFEGNIHNPKAVWMRRWKGHDAGTWDYYEQVHEYVWRDRFEYETTNYPQIGIVNTWMTIGEDSTETEIEFHPVYVDVYYIWGGIDIGEDVEIRNPCNWEEGERLPRPLLFDPGPNGELEYGHQRRGGRTAIGYGFLGIVRETAKAEVWPSRFTDITGPDEDAPVDDIFTVAQAKLFNNLSWDLWTQDWQVQLTPLSRWDQWLWELEVAQWEVNQVGQLVDEQELIEIDEYLRSIDENMTWRFFKH